MAAKLICMCSSLPFRVLAHILPAMCLPCISLLLFVMCIFIHCCYFPFHIYRYYEALFNRWQLMFIVCSDDMAWAKEHFTFSSRPIVYSENKTDAVDLAILTKCDHMIMTTGTFGWWAAWLAGGHVVYYSQYPRKHSRLERTFSKDKTDYFPPEWIRIPPV